LPQVADVLGELIVWAKDLLTIAQREIEMRTCALQPPGCVVSVRKICAHSQRLPMALA